MGSGKGVEIARLTVAVVATKLKTTVKGDHCFTGSGGAVVFLHTLFRKSERGAFRVWHWKFQNDFGISGEKAKIVYNPMLTETESQSSNCEEEYKHIT